MIKIRNNEIGLGTHSRWYRTRSDGFTTLRGSQIRSANGSCPMVKKRFSKSRLEDVNNKKHTFLRVGDFQVIVNAVSQTIKITHVLGRSNGRMLVKKVGDNFICGRGKFEEQGMVDILQKRVERKLNKGI